MNARIHRLQALLLALLMAGALIAAGWALHLRLVPEIPSPLRGVGGDFTLQSASGPIALQDFCGEAVLVYFGYTHCPDACPMALGTMARAMRQLPPAMQHRVAGIFVSVDPRRDTPDHLAQYARFFDPRIVGVTGTPAELARIADQWRAGFSVPEHPSSPNYSVDHSTFIYLVSPTGRVVALFDEATAPRRIALAMQRWLLAGSAKCSDSRK